MTQQAGDPVSPAQEKALHTILDEVTWEEITADGVITMDEMDAELRAAGYDPHEFDYLYDR